MSRARSSATLSTVLVISFLVVPAWGQVANDACTDPVPLAVPSSRYRRCPHRPEREHRTAGRKRSAPLSAVATITKASPVWTRVLPWGLTAALAVILLWNATARRSPATTRLPGFQLSIALPDSHPVYLANYDFELMPPMDISASGDRVVYVSTENEGPFTGSNQNELRVRSLDTFESETLVGAERGEQPFFSPDGNWIGFFRDNDLAKIPVEGGAPVVLATTSGPGNGASWGTDGEIIYAESYVGPLWRVPESGGEPVALTALDDDERSHRYPQILPDGKSVLFSVKQEDILTFDDGRIAVAEIATGEHRILLEGGMYARYVESGHLVYARNGGLLAAPFDLDRLEITGGAVPVLDGVITNPITGTAVFACSPGGTLVFVSGTYPTGLTSVFAFDRESGTRRTLIDDRMASFPNLSPEESRLVMHGSAAHDQVLVLDLERETLMRVSDTSGNNILPIWGPDEDRVVFTSDRSGQDEIVWMPAGGGGPMETLVEPTDLPQDAGSWSANGTLLAFNRGIRSSRDIWVLDVDAGVAAPFLDSPHYEGEPAFSPDGKWIAYSSDESGTGEIFISPYPGPGGRIQISSGGGAQPRWRGDGAELYYFTETAVVAVPMAWSPGPRPGRPQPLFEVNGRVPVGYDVTRDGQTFYVAEFDESRLRSTRIDVILNWFDALP